MNYFTGLLWRYNSLRKINRKKIASVPHTDGVASVNPCHFTQNDRIYYLSACEQLAMTLLEIQLIHLFSLTDRQPRLI